MLKECEHFAAESNVTFSTDPDANKSKSKMIFRCGKQTSLPKPPGARTYLVQQVLAPGSDILATFVNFFHSLRNAPSHEVLTAGLLGARDLGSVTGRNLALVTELSGQDPWTASSARVRQALMDKEIIPVPETDGWRCE